MSCPVCGAADPQGRCARCGTDLVALAGRKGEARLDVATLKSAPPASRVRANGPTF